MSQTRQLGLIATRPPPGAAGSRVLLVGGFQLVEGDALVALAEGSQRLLGLLALRGRPVKRVLVAGTLWPDVTEARAHASLRSALSRLYGAASESISRSHKRSPTAFWTPSISLSRRRTLVEQQ